MGFDLKRIWSKLEDVDYIILRNYSELQKEVETGGDIDILCDMRDVTIKKLNLVTRGQEGNLHNCKYVEGNMEVFIDVRYIGDGYYDEKWEKDMLERKRRYRDTYIMSKEDERYSLLYHVLIHKDTIPMKYGLFLENEFENKDTRYLIKELARYMAAKNYKPSVPEDQGADFNVENYKVLEEELYIFSGRI